MVPIETHLKKESSLTKPNWELWSKQDLERLKDKEPSRYLDQYLLGKFEPLKDGEECEHKGCRNHISHPCDNCGRIGASSKLTKEYYEKN